MSRKRRAPSRPKRRAGVWSRIERDTLWADCSAETLGIYVRLILWMHTRWQVSGLSADEACRATLTQTEASLITGKHQWPAILRAFRSLVPHFPITCQSLDGQKISIQWPKFAEMQGLHVRSRRQAAGTTETETEKESIKHTHDANSGTRNSPKGHTRVSASPSVCVSEIQEENSAEGLAASAWPGIRSAVSNLAGVTWPERVPRALIDRIADGETPEDLISAVRGYVALHRDSGWDWTKHCRPSVIFSPAKFAEYASRGASAGASRIEYDPTKPATQSPERRERMQAIADRMSAPPRPSNGKPSRGKPRIKS